VVLEAEHWHAPLCFAALQALGHSVAGVSSTRPEVRDRLTRQLGCPALDDYRALVQETRPDFAVAFGRPLDRPAIAAFLLDEGVPFAMEMPAGTTAGAAATVARRVRERGAFATVALPLRYGHFAREAGSLLQNGALGMPRHLHLRDMAESPARYVENGLPWVVDPQLAGGGALIGLGIHSVDMLASLSAGSAWTPATSFLQRDAGLPGESAIEQYALGILYAPPPLEGGSRGDPAIATIEAGFTHTRTVRDRSWSLFAEHGELRDDGHGLRIRLASHEPRQLETRDEEALYADFLADTLARFGAGQPPQAHFDDAVRALDVVERLYSLAARVPAVPWRLPGLAANP
jgi:predicted dehydrogenase